MQNRRGPGQGGVHGGRSRPVARAEGGRRKDQGGHPRRDAGGGDVTKPRGVRKGRGGVAVGTPGWELRRAVSEAERQQQLVCHIVTVGCDRVAFH